MARLLRIDDEGPLYHVTSRGDDRQSIFFEYTLKELSEHLGLHYSTISVIAKQVDQVFKDRSNDLTLEI